jgi:hypothetical protein
MSGRQSLAGAFAPAAPTRGAALQGLLPPKKRGTSTQAPEPKTPEASAEAPARESIVVPPEAVPEPVKEQKPAEQAPAETGEREAPAEESAPAPVTPKAAPRQPTAPRKAAAPAVKASETVPGALRNVGVYMPPALLAEVKDAVYQARTTYADLLIDAFEAVDDEQIAGEFAPETTLTNSGMPRRAPRKRGGPASRSSCVSTGCRLPGWMRKSRSSMRRPAAPSSLLSSSSTCRQGRPRGSEAAIRAGFMA